MDSLCVLPSWFKIRSVKSQVEIQMSFQTQFQIRAQTTPERSMILWMFLCLMLLAGCSDPQPELTLIEGRTMGTTYSVKALDVTDKQALAFALEVRLKAVNQLMSTYIADSEITNLNRLAVAESMVLSPENLSMLALADRINVESGGKFDVTLGPLIALWGFGADPRRTDVPDVKAINDALSRMGTDGLLIESSTVQKIRDIEVDFSAIAKGYGVDELARLVEQAGVTNYLVEIGGELRARGLSQRGQSWVVGIEAPDSTQRMPYTAVPLKDLAMATSGDYRNYFEVNGKRFSHILDPSTGYPITHSVVSVTVLAETTAEADGYATAINIMGEETGLALADRLNLPVMLIVKAEDGFATRTSRAFDAYLSEQTAQ
jgi:thiamine biosynthesis lipoprotein